MGIVGPEITRLGGLVGQEGPISQAGTCRMRKTTLPNGRAPKKIMIPVKKNKRFPLRFLPMEH